MAARQGHTSVMIEPQPQALQTVSYSNSSNLPNVQMINDPQYYTAEAVRTMPAAHQNYSNGQPMHHNMFDQHVTYSQPPKPFNGDCFTSSQSTNKPVKLSSFKLNPTVSSFVPQNIESFMHPEPFSNGQQKHVKGFATNAYGSAVMDKESYGMNMENMDVKGGNAYGMQGNDYGMKGSDYGMKINEGNVIVSDTNCLMTVNDSNSVKVQSIVKVSENVALKANENAVKLNENVAWKASENKNVNQNIARVDEKVVWQVSENKNVNENIAKVDEKVAWQVREKVMNENEFVKVENVAVKADDRVAKVRDVAKLNENVGVKNYKSELTKPVKVQDTPVETKEVTWNGAKQDSELEKLDPTPVKDNAVAKVADKVSPNAEIQETQQVSQPVRRSWADIVSKGQKPTEKVSLSKPVGENEKAVKKSSGEQETEVSIAEDKMSLVLGKHLFNLELNFNPVLLQPRGLINRRNWCYINATLQALLACPPFYTLVRNLPLGPGVERGKSSTPVIDSMVKVTYEFLQLDKGQEELQLGVPFQPDFIYDMLRDLKSDCLKGQQEDAEEFLSFILNGMHEEMVKIIKNYERKNHLELECETKENGSVSDGEEEWQVIGSKHKGMVTRKVAEHKTPISDLLGGQIKSFLTTSGNKTSASIQPFFTLQLDVQSENVTSVSEALKEMTIKEPIQGYTCAKTKQEVEAFSHIALQKLPPILILHLKRFVYNKNGGCKKVMKKTDYPLVLDINRDMFSPDVKKSQRLRQYKLFAVMYHDGEEAVKGHYISDVYNHGSQTWIRCDDRVVTAVTEEQVLSYSPPRVPYLLFYQES